MIAPVPPPSPDGAILFLIVAGLLIAYLGLERAQSRRK